MSRAGIEPLSPRRSGGRSPSRHSCWCPPTGRSVGFVSAGSDATRRRQPRSLAIAFGLMLIPFVFVALAFLSEHPMAREPSSRPWAFASSWASAPRPRRRRGDGHHRRCWCRRHRGAAADEPHSWRARVPLGSPSPLRPPSSSPAPRGAIVLLPHPSSRSGHRCRRSLLRAAVGAGRRGFTIVWMTDARYGAFDDGA